jgi:hypothetical protein
MSKPERPVPVILRGGNSAYPEWDKVEDDDLADCDAEGCVEGEVMRRDGWDTCSSCRGTGKGS